MWTSARLQLLQRLLRTGGTRTDLPTETCWTRAGCSGYDWSQDITDLASYRQCYLKKDLPQQNDDIRYVSGVLHRGGSSTADSKSAGLRNPVGPAPSTSLVLCQESGAAPADIAAAG